MLRKTTSIVVVSALILCLCVVSASAQVSGPQSQPNGIETVLAVNSAADKKMSAGPKRNEKLRSDIESLLNDARAGKVVPADAGQIKPAKSNNLSKGAKIAIGVGIAVVVIALIVKYQKDHLFDDLTLGN